MNFFGFLEWNPQLVSQSLNFKEFFLLLLSLLYLHFFLFLSCIVVKRLCWRYFLRVFRFPRRFFRSFRLSCILCFIVLPHHQINLHTFVEIQSFRLPRGLGQPLLMLLLKPRRPWLNQYFVEKVWVPVDHSCVFLITSIEQVFQNRFLEFFSLLFFGQETSTFFCVEMLFSAFIKELFFKFSLPLLLIPFIYLFDSA